MNQGATLGQVEPSAGFSHLALDHLRNREYHLGIADDFEVIADSRNPDVRRHQRKLLHHQLLCCITDRLEELESTDCEEQWAGRVSLLHPGSHQADTMSAPKKWSLPAIAPHIEREQARGPLVDPLESILSPLLGECTIQIKSLHRATRVKGTLSPFRANLTATGNAHSELYRGTYSGAFHFNSGTCGETIENLRQVKWAK
jgi:hypothetical protein